MKHNLFKLIPPSFDDMQETKYEFPSWEQIAAECRKIAGKIRAAGFKPDVVLALSRGGLVPARIVCDLLIVKDLVSIKVDHWGITAQKDGSARLRYPVNIDLEGKKILIVDDITDTGESLSLALDWVKKQNPADAKSAVVYHINHSKTVPDFFGEEIKSGDWAWIVWPWNLVEDISNILLKELDGKTLSADEIKKLFAEKHFSGISGDMAQDALSALEGKLLVRQNQDGTWSKL
ncbi:MAG: phosphoribosyltransferase [Nanoarchaeota archaeon]|nr:phosphoribosyltransferase [Nanoarchaeota archaeon]